MFRHTSSTEYIHRICRTRCTCRNPTHVHDYLNQGSARAISFLNDMVILDAASNPRHVGDRLLRIDAVVGGAIAAYDEPLTRRVNICSRAGWKKVVFPAVPLLSSGRRRRR
jgi:hypothetical protein